MVTWADANGIETLGQLASVSPATLSDQKDLGRESIAETRAVIERALGRSWESFAAVAGTIARDETTAAPSAKRETVGATSAMNEAAGADEMNRARSGERTVAEPSGTATQDQVAGAARPSEPDSSPAKQFDSSRAQAPAQPSFASTLLGALPTPARPDAAAVMVVSERLDAHVELDSCTHCGQPVDRSGYSRAALLHGWALTPGGGALGMLCIATDGEDGVHVPIVEFDLERAEFEFCFCDTKCLRALLSARVDELEKAGDGGAG